jgi:hypothetical protein
VNSAAGNSASATVIDADLIASGQGALVQGVEGLGLSQDGGTTFGPVVIGTFTDTDPGSTVADFTTPPGSIVVNWGDGTVETLPASDLTATVSSNGVLFTITAAHVYTEEGSYQILTTVTDAGGAVAVLHGEADVADAKLSQATAQPDVHTIESPIFPVPAYANPLFTGPVGSFVDSNPGGTVDDFKATIDWGDGTATSFGTISQDPATGAFIVTGSHTYGDAGVTTGTGTFGTFPITIHVTDVGGSKLTVNNSAKVDDRSIPLAGKLNPKSDSGISNADAITKVRQPSFYGTSEPRSNVTLWASTGGGAPFQIAQTVAKADGSWSVSSKVALLDGIYTITATAVDQFGKTVVTTPASPVVITPRLVVDGTGPVVTSVFFDRLHGQIDITYTDNLAGLWDRTLVDASNYTFVKTISAKQHIPYLINSAFVAPGGNATHETVILTVNGGQPIRGGFYTFTIRSASPVKVSGVQDIAGNALDGEFYGFFPSGNHVPGGDFVATLDAVHNVIFPPGTVVGRSTPNVPPGTVQPPVFIPTQVPGKASVKAATVKTSAPKAASVVSTKLSAHDLALTQVSVPKKKPIH